MDPFAPWRDTIPLAAGVPRRKPAPRGEVFETPPTEPRKRRHFTLAAGAIAARMFLRTRQLLSRTRGVTPIPAAVEEAR